MLARASEALAVPLLFWPRITTRSPLLTVALLVMSMQTAAVPIVQVIEVAPVMPVVTVVTAAVPPLPLPEQELANVNCLLLELMEEIVHVPVKPLPPVTPEMTTVLPVENNVPRAAVSVMVATPLLHTAPLPLLTEALPLSPVPEQEALL